MEHDEILEEQRDCQESNGKELPENKKKKVGRKKLKHKSRTMECDENIPPQGQSLSQEDRSRSKARQAKLKLRQASTEDDSKSDNNAQAKRKERTPIARRLRERPGKINYKNLSKDMRGFN